MIRSSTLYAILAHATTIIIPFVLMWIPIFNATETIAEVDGLTQYIVKRVTLLDAHGDTMLFIISFPWIVSGVSLMSIIMGKYQKSYSKRIAWRWKSYTWGSLFIMGCFVFLSIESVGLFYIPTIFLILLSIIFNK
tara:strand:- start:2944 stop:3351 length:408 start_codon:yes stop_codon:yes gene_type:complete